jgi:hypothetical protein
MFNLQLQLLAVQSGCTLDPFWYHIDFLPATASTNTTGQFVVQSDAAFIILGTTYVVTDTQDAAIANLQPFGSGGASSFSPFLVSQVDQGAGRSLQYLPVEIDSIFGLGREPHIWQVPKILDQNSTFSVTLQNLSATDRRVRLTWHGAKIFGQVGNLISKLRVS